MSDNPYDWDELDAIEENRKEIEAARHVRAKAYYHVFAQDKEGQKILTEWVNEYCTGNPPGANASEREVGMAEGKRQLIKMILDQITIATGGSQ